MEKRNSPCANLNDEISPALRRRELPGRRWGKPILPPLSGGNFSDPPPTRGDIREVYHTITQTRRRSRRLGAAGLLTISTRNRKCRRGSAAFCLVSMKRIRRRSGGGEFTGFRRKAKNAAAARRKYAEFPQSETAAVAPDKIGGTVTHSNNSF